MLEKNLRQLMDCVDDVAMDANRFLNYQRQYYKQHLQKQQFVLKRVCFWTKCIHNSLLSQIDTGPGWLNELGSWITYNSKNLSPIRRGFAPGFVNYKKGCTRLAAASDKVYQLLAHGRWFSPGTPASSTKTGRHDIAEILLKVALTTKKNQSINQIDTNKPL